MSHCVPSCAVIQLYYYFLVSVSSWGEFLTLQQKEVPPAFRTSLTQWEHWKKVVPMDSVTPHCWLLLGAHKHLCATAPAAGLVKLIKVTGTQQEQKVPFPTPNHCMATQMQVKHCGDLNWDEKWAAEARQEESFVLALIICETTAETLTQIMWEELLKYSYILSHW